MTASVIASFALLQGAPTQAIPQMIFMYGAIFAIFYFVLIRPQQKQRKSHEERVKTLKKGDEIVTAGGIVGEVLHIASQGKDGAATLADRITIKSGESKLIVERGRIAAVGGGTPAA
ncbi:preprotein translocase subunit YajC [Gemmatimonas phototrophica]|jgi:preprotein translocase subunit YajC|uniref:preprotein translocase subunit YajC n=1 Tax=Gemmatimonas phototrophica TaxID=1379270 RepID=UPI0006A707C4|nr:preprotein translocase subunit YajC [Gemmatimonas phototrophica]